MENNENNEQAGYVPNRVIDKSVLKTYFENGDIPNEEEFWEWQDSYWHKDENIPTRKIDGLTEAIANAGQNIYNTNGTLNGPRILSTVGNPLNITGLPNKSSDATFSRMRVQNESGQEAWSMGTNQIISAMTAATDTNKDTWRAAQLKTGENFSNAAPRIDFVFPSFMVKNASADVIRVSCYGINLFINPTNSVVKIVNITTNTEYSIVTNTIETYANNGALLNFSIDISSLPIGTYKVKVVNQLGIQNIDTVSFKIVDNLVTKPVPSLTWERVNNSSFSSHPSTGGVGSTLNLVKQASVSGGFSTVLDTFKSSEVLTANEAEGDWILNLDITSTMHQFEYWGGVLLGIIQTNKTIGLFNSNDYGVKFGDSLNSTKLWTLYPTTQIGYETHYGGVSQLSHRLSIEKRGVNIRMLLIIGGVTYYSAVVVLSQNFTSGIGLYGCLFGSNSGSANIENNYTMTLSQIILL